MEAATISYEGMPPLDPAREHIMRQMIEVIAHMGPASIPEGQTVVGVVPFPGLCREAEQAVGRQLTVIQFFLLNWDTTLRHGANPDVANRMGDVAARALSGILGCRHSDNTWRHIELIWVLEGAARVAPPEVGIEIAARYLAVLHPDRPTDRGALARVIALFAREGGHPTNALRGNKWTCYVELAAALGLTRIQESSAEELRRKLAQRIFPS